SSVVNSHQLAVLCQPAHAYFLISTILYWMMPAGTLTSTTEPFFLPRIALPTGLSLEILFSEGSDSAVPTIVYSTASPNSTSSSVTIDPMLTTSVPMSSLLI